MIPFDPDYFAFLWFLGSGFLLFISAVDKIANKQFKAFKGFKFWAAPVFIALILSVSVGIFLGLIQDLAV
ncbi:hypothetical protein HW115_01380 [Verrucomicrobiaceae bacterium N1E253]|uniref:DUF2788 domain-containing protein n=1 Tax=Oceaniferula marina TaxID=2748318 RepID=A0A851GA02_9BACT|nr:hypothetical protein [Oceaniferula marina]NWK54246.1 hypothetical protein [Oceaniferula marina]